MTEVPLPEEIQRPAPIRIFSGARIREDGSFVSPAHQMLSDLWLHETIRRTIPGTLRVIPFGLPEEHKKTAVIQPLTHKDSNTIEALRDKFERGVKAWIHDGEPRYFNIDDFRDHYIPKEETRPSL